MTWDNSWYVYMNDLFFYVEDVNDPQWTLHKKHVFAFSEAGKPIYSRWKFFFITSIIINFDKLKWKLCILKSCWLINKAWESAQENASTLHDLNRTHYSYLLHFPGITRHCSMLYAYWSNGRRYKPKSLPQPTPPQGSTPWLCLNTIYKCNFYFPFIQIFRIN